MSEEMRLEQGFEGLLDQVLQECANPAAAPGLEGRMLAAVREEGTVSSVPMFAGGEERVGLWRSLVSGVRELVWPRRLPPLVLRSRPVAAAEESSEDGGLSAAAYAVGVHAMAMLLIGFVVRAQVREAQTTHRFVEPLVVPVLHVAARVGDMAGGGGGQRGMAPASRGSLPRAEERPLTPPSQPPMIQSKIVLEPTVEMQTVRMADGAMPNVGMPGLPLAGISLGNGRGTGIGSGDGAGVGPGRGDNVGGGLRRVGGGVSEPVVLYQVEPEFSEEARKAKISGDVTVYLWVDEQGRPSHLRVARGMGYGLDEKALEAVRQYRFRPAMENGRPVTVEMYVVVDFNIL